MKKGRGVPPLFSVSGLQTKDLRVVPVLSLLRRARKARSPKLVVLYQMDTVCQGLPANHLQVGGLFLLRFEGAVEKYGSFVAALVVVYRSRYLQGLSCAEVRGGILER